MPAFHRSSNIARQILLHRRPTWVLKNDCKDRDGVYLKRVHYHVTIVKTTRQRRYRYPWQRSSDYKVPGQRAPSPTGSAHRLPSSVWLVCSGTRSWSVTREARDCRPIGADDPRSNSDRRRTLVWVFPTGRHWTLSWRVFRRPTLMTTTMKMTRIQVESARTNCCHRERVSLTTWQHKRLERSPTRLTTGVVSVSVCCICGIVVLQGKQRNSIFNRCSSIWKDGQTYIGPAPYTSLLDTVCFRVFFSFMLILLNQLLIVYCPQ